MTTLSLYAARLFVGDYDRAREFYADRLGLPVAWEIAEHGAIGFAAGTAQLIVETVDPGDPEAAGLVGRFSGLSLQVEDIQAACRALEERGVVFDGPPERQFWGGWLAHFKDPAGNTLTLLG